MKLLIVILVLCLTTTGFAYEPERCLYPLTIPKIPGAYTVLFGIYISQSLPNSPEFDAFGSKVAADLNVEYTGRHREMPYLLKFAAYPLEEEVAYIRKSFPQEFSELWSIENWCHLRPDFVQKLQERLDTYPQLHNITRNQDTELQLIFAID